MLWRIIIIIIIIGNILEIFRMRTVTASCLPLILVTMMVLAGHQNRVTPIGDQIVDVVSNFSI
jgi:hypothetical protein